ncbi:hypothetical protein FB451DRAFT_1195102 [Mycena latifolia]|nr:hypothetical protein FB451DRAFT_1195102 [Mycena latifolia]
MYSSHSNKKSHRTLFGTPLDRPGTLVSSLIQPESVTASSNFVNTPVPAPDRRINQKLVELYRDPAVGDFGPTGSSAASNIPWPVENNLTSATRTLCSWSSEEDRQQPSWPSKPLGRRSSAGKVLAAAIRPSQQLRGLLEFCKHPGPRHVEHNPTSSTRTCEEAPSFFVRFQASDKKLEPDEIVGGYCNNPWTRRSHSPRARVATAQPGVRTHVLLRILVHQTDETCPDEGGIKKSMAGHRSRVGAGSRILNSRISMLARASSLWEPCADDARAGIFSIQRAPADRALCAPPRPPRAGGLRASFVADIDGCTRRSSKIGRGLFGRWNTIRRAGAI